MANSMNRNGAFSKLDGIKPPRLSRADNDR
jgi:hypothetical protein